MRYQVQKTRFPRYLMQTTILRWLLFGSITPRQNWIAIFIVIALGLAVRGNDIAYKYLWIDELESTINALTILDHGVPVDHYLGQPIYENTLVKKWPESEEYEFKDSSYSDKGLAVYHGWLPLYSIAAALKISGIAPDRDQQGPVQFRTSHADVSLRSWVPRAPSLVFSAIFLLTMYLVGERIGGRSTGWAALLLASFTAIYTEYGDMARYYSATLALTGAACWTMLRVMDREGIRAWLIHGIVLGLLFHTHILSCFIACLMTAILGIKQLNHRSGWIGSVSCVTVLIVFAVPWMIFTDYLSAFEDLPPKAWHFMDHPVDWLRYTDHPLSTYIYFIAITGSFIFIKIRGDLIPDNTQRTFDEYSTTLLVLFFWGLFAFIAFNMIMPLASHWPKRVWLVTAIPKILIAALAISIAATLFRQLRGRFIIPLICMATMAAPGNLDINPFVPSVQSTDWMVNLNTQLNKQRFPAKTRFYATPGIHFLVSYYSGVKVQTVAPVRHNYIQNYPNEIVYIDYIASEPRWTVSHVYKHAASYGITPDLSVAEELARRLSSRKARIELANKVRKVSPEPGPIPFYLQDAQDWFDQNPNPLVSWLVNSLVFKGFELNNNDDAWSVFFYRFVDPVTRLKAFQNLPRITESHAIDIWYGMTVLRSPAPMTTSEQGSQQ